MAKKIALSVLLVLVALYVAALTLPFDPDEQRPGTVLSGALADEQNPAWENRGRKKIYVQTRTWYGIPHSVTTVSWVLDGELYVPCRACATKRWPRNVAADPQVRLQIDGQLYDRTAVLIEDEAQRRALLGVAPGEATPDVWVYRMVPS